MKRCLWFALVVSFVLPFKLIGTNVEAQDTSLPVLFHRDYVALRVNDDSTITAVYSFAYARDDDEPFSLVIPVPSVPTVLEIGDAITLPSLEVASEVLVEEPTEYCSELFPIAGWGHAFPPYTFLTQAPIVQTDVINPAQTADVKAALAEQGHQLSDEMISQLEHYIADGMVLVAIKADPPPYSEEHEYENAGITYAIKITYPAKTVSIPLSAYQPASGRELLVFLFGDTQFVPQNYAFAQPDFNNLTLRAQHRIGRMGHVVDEFRHKDFSEIYPGEITRLLTEFQDGGFVTQFADFPSSELKQTDHSVYIGTSNPEAFPFLTNLTDGQPYMTRLYTRPSAGQLSEDPVFVPDAAAPPMSNIIHIGDWIDPLVYWGCSSRTVLNHRIESEALPEGFRLDAERFAVAYPHEWHMSEFEAPTTGQTMWAISPDAVDTSDVVAFLNGDDAPPMLVFTPINEWLVDFDSNPRTSFIDLFLPADGNDAGSAINASFSVDTRYNPENLDSFSTARENPRGMMFAMLVSPDAWEQNRDLFNMIVGYARSYENYAAPQFRHTLFLSGPNRSYETDGFVTLVPFPDGWIEQTLEGGDILIAPENADLGSSPVIRLRLVNNLLPEPSRDNRVDLGDPAAWQSVVEWAVDEYNLSSDVDWGQEIAKMWTCRQDLPALPFSHAGRSGLIRFTHRYVVEVSAPDIEFEANAVMLEELITGIVSQVTSTTESCE